MSSSGTPESSDALETGYSATASFTMSYTSVTATPSISLRLSSEGRFASGAATGPPASSSQTTYGSTTLGFPVAGSTSPSWGSTPRSLMRRNVPSSLTKKGASVRSRMKPSSCHP